jgi:putative copper resistance protein D
MLEEQLITARWAVYLDLGLLFGLPFFRLYGGIGDTAVGAYRLRLPLVGLALGGLLLSAWQFTAMVAGTTGATELSFDGQTLIMVLKETSVGLAFAARTAALTFVVALALNTNLQTRSWTAAISFCAGIAVATLAWGGHAAATEGPLGYVHFASDILHLLAVAAWIGALVSFLWAASSNNTPESAATTHRALAAFATWGSVLVGVIILTGLINSVVLIGWRHLISLGTTAYGRLLIIKLALFAGMLVLAAINRFRLTPWLKIGIGSGSLQAPSAALRRSLWFEMSLGVMILALVAWLGTLPPPGAD